MSKIVFGTGKLGRLNPSKYERGIGLLSIRDRKYLYPACF